MNPILFLPLYTSGGGDMSPRMAIILGAALLLFCLGMTIAMLESLLDADDLGLFIVTFCMELALIICDGLCIWLIWSGFHEKIVR